MIKKMTDNDAEQVNSIIETDFLQNPYLYIDSKTYGYWYKDYITTWLVGEGSAIHAILYKYYNTLQLFCSNRLTSAECNEIAANILHNEFEMITGSAKELRPVFQKIASVYTKSEGHILTGKACVNTAENMTNFAVEEDCHEIAQLICSEKNIGAHYTPEILENQLVDRMKNWGCKNLIIRKNDRIVSHMATYADSKKIAVLSGLVTHPDYRGNGFGRIILNNLARQVISEGKEPILFCYGGGKLVKWYQRQGWEIITECTKLVKKHGVT